MTRGFKRLENPWTYHHPIGPEVGIKYFAVKSPSPPLHSTPLPLEVGPLKPARWSGGAL